LEKSLISNKEAKIKEKEKGRGCDQVKEIG
jgi:hypothetical protein